MRRRKLTEDALRLRLLLNLRKLREARKPRHWRQIEAGEGGVTLQRLVRVAETLKIDPADLLRRPSRVTSVPAPSVSFTLRPDQWRTLSVRTPRRFPNWHTVLLSLALVVELAVLIAFVVARLYR